jgi:hypothetical protein
MSAAATETSCFGDTSIASTRSGVIMSTSPACRQVIRSSVNLPLASSNAFAWATVYFDSSIAERYMTSSVTRPSLTLRYGLSMKPYLLTRAKVASELMSPIFGPSGVSIGQMRP